MNQVTIFILFLSFLYNLFANDLITPIPENNIYNEKKAKLGKMLFFDTRLSSDNTISCASCHMLDQGGDDNLSVAIGVGGKVGTRNTPTVYNSKFNFTQFWDGRVDTLEEQAKGPIHNKIEMNSTFEEVISKLKKDRDINKTFYSIYKDGITATNITDAIAEFEKALVTPNSRFDRYLKGEKYALNEIEKKGYEAFKDYGCISCHNGVNMGGNVFQKIGLVKEFTNISDDFGRYLVTKEVNDRYVFKVPTLRNIELTAPYFHNGTVESLRDAVKVMIDYQVGMVLNEDDIDNIVAFLKTLNGQLPKIVKD